MSAVEVGGRIDGKYEVLGHIGGGGMGEVYRVRHIHLEELRVIKVMRTDLARSSEAIERFGNEARLATKIKHPSVATLHDFSRLPDDSFYMVWEYIEGQDVEGWLQRRGRFPLPIALELAMQVLSGLGAVHEAGIVHRDLSPDNLMITTDARGRLGVKIIDLGLADQVTATGKRSDQVGGKLNYCSPEHLGLIEGVPPDHISDLYSFAIVLYRMLTGVLPFPKAKGAADVAVRESTPARALSIETVHRVMQKALAYDRAARYQLAAEFRKELEDLQQAVEEQQNRAREEESQTRLQAAAVALDESRLEEADQLLRELEATVPSLDGLSELRDRFADQAKARRQVQVMQMREMVEQYLASKQKALARLSLDSLLELEADHRDREVLEQRVQALEEAEAERDRVQRLLGQARSKLAAGDEVSARALHSQLAGLDQQAADFLGALLENREQEQGDAEQIGIITQRIEELLARPADTQTFAQIEQEVGALAALGASKVTQDRFLHRMEALRDSQRSSAEIDEILRLFPEAVASGQWQEARRLVSSLGNLDSDHPQLGAMLAEVDAGDQESRRRDAVAEGVSTLTALLDSGRLEEARTALKVLLRMNSGDHPLKSHFEQRIEELSSRRT